jgi:hypothetical protein
MQCSVPLIATNLVLLDIYFEILLTRVNRRGFNGDVPKGHEQEKKQVI